MASFGSYNLLDYGRIPDPERERGVRAVIEALDVDVLAVQEIYGRTRSEAAARLAELAESVGMTAYTETPAYDEDDVAIGFGNNDLHVGLMWRPERVSPVAGTCRSYHTLFWHALIKVTLEVPGGDGTSHAVQHASYHAGPFGQPLRVAEAERVVSALTRPNDRPPASSERIGTASPPTAPRPAPNTTPTPTRRRPGVRATSISASGAATPPPANLPGGAPTANPPRSSTPPDSSTPLRPSTTPAPAASPGNRPPGTGPATPSPCDASTASASPASWPRPCGPALSPPVHPPAPPSVDPAPIRAPCRTTSGALAGAGNSVALDINDHGQIVGYEGDQTTAAARALMWTAPPPEG